MKKKKVVKNDSDFFVFIAIKLIFIVSKFPFYDRNEIVSLKKNKYNRCSNKKKNIKNMVLYFDQVIFLCFYQNAALTDRQQRHGIDVCHALNRLCKTK